MMKKKISNLLIHWDRIVVGLVELFFPGSKTIVIKILKQEKKFEKIFSLKSTGQTILSRESKKKNSKIYESQSIIYMH